MIRWPKGPSGSAFTPSTLPAGVERRQRAATCRAAFLDRRARFRFLDPAKAAPKPGEIGFDIVGGDFTHEGDRCTFETLLARAGRSDPALTAIAEIVHDVDGKFGRDDAAGVRQLVDGIIRSHRRDEDRLARAALLEDLYASFRQSSAGSARSPRRRGR
jgi:hypothetical protein